MVSICLIFRQPRAFYYSIEKIFRSVSAVLKPHLTIDEVVVTHSRLTPWNIFHNIYQVNSKKAKVYHITGDVHYLILGLPGKRTILTIHDCVFLYQGSRLKRLLLKKLLLDWPVRYSTAVTTISEYSRQDIIKNTACDPQKVTVIPNPVGEHFYFSQKEFESKCPVVLFVGTAPHKNLNRVAEALDGIPCILDILGQLSVEQKALLKNHGVKFKETTGLTEQQLADKYAAADFLLFPTLFEGFGLPIIEAQAAGRPVITSNMGPMNKVAGKGACLVDPYDVSSIRKAVLKVINDTEYYRELVNNGTENVKLFSVDKIAEQYKKLYTSILGKENYSQNILHKTPSQKI